MSPNPAPISTTPATIAADELPPVNGSGTEFGPGTVVDEPPPVTTDSDIVVDVVPPGTVVVPPAVVTVEIVVVVTAGDVVVVPGTLDVVVDVDSPVVGGVELDVVDVPARIVVVVVGHRHVVVVVDGGGGVDVDVGLL